MATEVITRKLCDAHGVRDEKVEADDVIQFAYDGVVREVDACAGCKEEHEARFEPLVEVSRVVKKRRKSKTEPEEPATEPEPAAESSAEPAVSGMAAG